MAASRQRTSAAQREKEPVLLTLEQRKSLSTELMERLSKDADVLREHADGSAGNPNIPHVSLDAQSWVGMVRETSALLDLIGWPHELWPPLEAPEGKGGDR